MTAHLRQRALRKGAVGRGGVARRECGRHGFIQPGDRRSPFSPRANVAIPGVLVTFSWSWLTSTDPLDAYSAIVVGVADTLTPRVAALRIRGRRGESAGSAVVLSSEGHLVTNAHVVGDAAVRRGRLRRRHDREVRRRRRRPAVRPGRRTNRPGGAEPAGVRRCRLVAGRLTRGGGREPARSGRQRHRRRGLRAGPVDAGARANHRTAHRGRDPDRRLAQPRQLGRSAGRRPGSRGRHQHGRRRHRAGAGRADQRHDQPDHLPAAARRSRTSRVPRPGEQPRSPAAAPGRPGPASRPR